MVKRPEQVLCLAFTWGLSLLSARRFQQAHAVLMRARCAVLTLCCAVLTLCCAPAVQLKARSTPEHPAVDWLYPCMAGLAAFVQACLQPLSLLAWTNELHDQVCIAHLCIICVCVVTFRLVCSASSLCCLYWWSG